MREKMLGFHDVSHTDTKACRRKTWTADIRRLSLMSGALPVSSLAALALMVCTCMAAQTVMMIATPVARWASVDAAMREGLLLIGVVIAVFTTWAGRALGRNCVVIGRVCGRGADDILLRRFTATSAAVVSGYAAGCVPLLVRTAYRATWGAPPVLAMMSDGMALMMLCAFGMVLGALIGCRWAYLVVPVATLALMISPWAVTGSVLSGTGHSVLSLGVLWFHAFPDIGWVPTWQAGVFRCTLFAAATLTMVRYGMARVTGRSPHMDMTLWCSAGVCVAMMVSALCWPVPLVRRDTDKLSCVREPNFTVCLHPADEPLRPSVTQTVQEVLRLAPQDKVLRIAEYVYAEQEPETDMVLMSVPDATSSRASIEQAVIENMGVVVSGSEMCLHSDAPSEEKILADEIAKAVDSSVRRRLDAGSVPIGVDEVTGDPVYSSYQPLLDRLNDEEFAQWYTTHREAILSCHVTESDFPAA